MEPLTQALKDKNEDVRKSRSYRKFLRALKTLDNLLPEGVKFNIKHAQNTHKGMLSNLHINSLFLHTPIFLLKFTKKCITIACIPPAQFFANLPLKFHGINKNNYYLYLKEMEFRFNNRGENIFNKMFNMIYKRFDADFT
ncbi:MAG: hypothetical protein A7316_03445 [Candidatus Altiarchaeales archaeon WOR_SM1_86-2]|nr:MAG: hypothetical protein A7316_03445 [Candidatus Altiarchaeales archaeon WOR_SM1_86-2]